MCLYNVRYIVRTMFCVTMPASEYSDGVTSCEGTGRVCLEIFWASEAVLEDL